MERALQPYGLRRVLAALGISLRGPESLPLAAPAVRVPHPAVEGVKLDKLCCDLSGRRVADGLNVELTEKRIGIIGRNGSGKSTLLKLIAGLRAPSAGSVRVHGIDPATDRKALLSTLGILFQNPDHQILFPTVGEELAFCLLQQGASRADAAAAVTALLALEGRPHWHDATTNSLSDGQRHYLNLLSILLMRPKIILLDGPFAGIDLPTTIRLLRRLAALPLQIIAVRHDPETLMVCDRALWIEEGRIERDGPVTKVLRDYIQAMTNRGLFDADTDLAG
ncbi:MAG: hypothetical protein RLZZ444_3498 [Pseudomonadota bacterium]|jgi:biotin transport system ATP-binding protein